MMSSNKVFRGKKVFLKQPQRDELDYIRQLWSDPKTMKEVGGPIEFSKQALIDWYINNIDPGSPSNCYFLIYIENEIPIGEVSFRGWDHSRREANLNIKIQASYRGKGYASDALRTFLKYCFRDINAEKLIDDLDPENLGAKHFLEKFGFEEQGKTQDPRRMVLTRNKYFDLAQLVDGGDATR